MHLWNWKKLDYIYFMEGNHFNGMLLNVCSSISYSTVNLLSVPLAVSPWYPLTSRYSPPSFYFLNDLLNGSVAMIHPLNRRYLKTLWWLHLCVMKDDNKCEINIKLWCIWTLIFISYWTNLVAILIVEKLIILLLYICNQYFGKLLTEIFLSHFNYIFLSRFSLI